MKPKDLLSAVRERHPNATKKEIVRAAFYALIESHGVSSVQAQNLHISRSASAAWTRVNPS